MIVNIWSRLTGSYYIRHVTTTTANSIITTYASGYCLFMSEHGCILREYTTRYAQNGGTTGVGIQTLSNG
jgi:hypothetical protein